MIRPNCTAYEYFCKSKAAAANKKRSNGTPWQVAENVGVQRSATTGASDFENQTYCKAMPRCASNFFRNGLHQFHLLGLGCGNAHTLHAAIGGVQDFKFQAFVFDD